MIIGSRGQLGSDLMQLFGSQATGFTRGDLDITDRSSVNGALHSLRPDWVINTAAFNRVDECELDPTVAFTVNTIAAANVARSAEEVGAGVVFFSSDYVFGGRVRERRHPFCEADAPEPQNVYGVSKWAGEQLVAQGNPRHIVVRTAALYGAVTSRKGWTFPEIILNKARSGEVLRVVDDQITSPTFTIDLADMVKELIERNAAGLFHVTNTGECSWYEFALLTLKLAGINASIEPINSAQAGLRARRPAYSAMTSMRLPELGLNFLRPWQSALQDYLSLKVLSNGVTV